jgi:hypothetical protein
MHHIISDGVSLGILQRDFFRLYEAYRGGKEIEPDKVEFQYKDFTQWQNRQINNPLYKEKFHRYWKLKLKDGFPVLELPVDFHVNPGNKSGAGFRCIIAKDITNRLKQLAKTNNTTLSMVMFAAYNLLLSHFSGQKDIVCALIEAGRDYASLYNILGFFTKSVIVKSHVDYREDFDRFLSRINNDVLEALQYQVYPLELLLDDLNIKYPDISISFNMLNIFEWLGDMELDYSSPFHIPRTREVKFDIEVYIAEYKNGIDISWLYRKSMFRSETIEDFSNVYSGLLSELSGTDGE